MLEKLSLVVLGWFTLHPPATSIVDIHHFSVCTTPHSYRDSREQLLIRAPNTDMRQTSNNTLSSNDSPLSVTTSKQLASCARWVGMRPLSKALVFATSQASWTEDCVCCFFEAALIKNAHMGRCHGSVCTSCSTQKLATKQH